jgi:hypothetical protein
MIPGKFFFCIGKNKDFIEHGFLIDTRFSSPVLLDTSLSGPVEYTENSVPWIKSWSNITILDPRTLSAML